MGTLLAHKIRSLCTFVFCCFSLTVLTLPLNAYAGNYNCACQRLDRPDAFWNASKTTGKTDCLVEMSSVEECAAFGKRDRESDSRKYFQCGFSNSGPTDPCFFQKFPNIAGEIVYPAITSCQGAPCSQSKKKCTEDADCQGYDGKGICGRMDKLCYLTSTGMARFNSQPTLLGIAADLQLKKPIFEVRIPGLKFTDIGKAIDDEGYLHIPYLGEFISLIYKLAMGLGSIVAVVMMITQGVKIIVSEGGELQTEAYHRIGQIVIGLIILWGSYAILYTINPELVQFRILKVQYIQPIAYEYGGDSEAGLNIKNLPPEFFCPKSGGVSNIEKIVSTALGKVSYRFGGKGGPPPYGEIAPEFKQYNNSCWANNICLDCSGFINFVYYCAGIPTIGGGTKTIFTGAEAITSSFDPASPFVNGKALLPGDLIGWKEGDGGKQVGHVLMYLGNGKVVESHGGKPGRQAGANPRISSLQSLDPKTYKFTYVRRLTP